MPNSSSASITRTRPATPGPTHASPTDQHARSVPATRSTRRSPNRATSRGLNLETGEVALVTKAQPVWTAKLASASAHSVTFRWVSVRPTARLLNAARNQGLAARTRAHLEERGWKRIEIGDAPAVRSRTLVLYPAFRRATAQRLAAQFGFSEMKPFNGSEIVVLLGRDAAAMKVLRPA